MRNSTLTNGSISPRQLQLSTTSTSSCFPDSTSRKSSTTLPPLCTDSGLHRMNSSRSGKTRIMTMSLNGKKTFLTPKNSLLYTTTRRVPNPGMLICSRLSSLISSCLAGFRDTTSRKTLLRSSTSSLNISSTEKKKENERRKFLGRFQSK